MNYGQKIETTGRLRIMPTQLLVWQGLEKYVKAKLSTEFRPIKDKT